jgi:hypothetical protein
MAAPRRRGGSAGAAAAAPDEVLLLGRYRCSPSLLGAGTYGRVYLGEDVETGALVAVKRIVVDPEEDGEGLPATALREVALLRELDHPNICRLLDAAFDSDSLRLSLVFEHCERVRGACAAPFEPRAPADALPFRARPRPRRTCARRWTRTTHAERIWRQSRSGA